MTDERAQRAADRSRWPVRLYRLGQEPSDDLSAQTTPGERLEMMWPLAVEAWTLAGKNLPTYRREAIPIQVRRTPGA